MSLDYLIREPENIQPNTPILFLLHGYGSNEEDLFSFEPNLPKDWLVVSFRAPTTSNFGGYQWYEIDWNEPDNFTNIPQAETSLNLLIQSITEIKEKFGVQNAPTHLCGFSQGGILVYTLALKFPQYFSKIACLSTYPEAKLLNHIKPEKKALQHLRFFISHGTDDAVIPIDWARKSAELLYDYSVYFSFREYLSGHGINQKNFMDLMQFFENPV